MADAWTTSDDVRNSKPAPDVVAAALAKVEGATGIMVGDSVHAVASSRSSVALGCRPLGR